MESFERDNKVSLNFIKEIEKIWKGLGEFYLIPFVNMHTLFIETGKQKNSNMIVLSKGGSKSDFLTTINENNPKSTELLPEKMYESMLAKKPKDYYDGKAMLHPDLIIAFDGLGKKQKQQLMGFWTALLSDKKYERQEVQRIDLIKGCVSIFGLAFDSYNKYKESMFESTFLDRVFPIHKPTKRSEKGEIIDFIGKISVKKGRKLRKNPVLKLKTRLKPLKIDLNIDDFGDKIRYYSLEIDDFGIVSFTRAYFYIVNFLKANAYLNNREKVTENDLKLFEKLYKFHVDKRDIDKYNKFVILMKENPNKKDKELIEIGNFNERTFYRMKKIWREKTQDL